MHQGQLHPLCEAIFRTPSSDNHPNGESLQLHRHQAESIALATQGESFAVTTGTGSGKSLCFFIPIIDAILRQKPGDASPRTRALIIYPMNALANSQLEEIEKYLSNVSHQRPVTYARYTGQESSDERERIAAHAPDILLTNFMMLELLMTRQDELDRRVINNCNGLRFLVLDELHTYRGRQGADVALLVRRVRERLARGPLQCIGTSATMASEGSLEEKNRVIARVASKLFAAEIPESNVVVETLERATDPNITGDSVAPLLGAAIDAGVPRGMRDADLRVNPLAIWIETRLGIAWSETDQRWLRARPLTVTEAVRRLAEDARRDEDACRTALRDLLLHSSVPEGQRIEVGAGSPTSFFAFKLHQYLSGAGHCYATLEAVGERRVTVDGQTYLPGDDQLRLYATHFCRDCGQEYHPVRCVGSGANQMVLARDIEDAAPSQNGDEAVPETLGGVDEEERFGFLIVHPPDDEFSFENREEDFPESWLDVDTHGASRLKRDYRNARPVAVHVAGDGHVGSGVKCWLLPGKFRLCLRCKNTHGGPSRDRSRLASLSAEGRSSATTILVSSALRVMHENGSGLDPNKRKLLGFTDNRQDAALQAGHFNDFLFVSLFRAGFLAALAAAGDAGLGSDALGLAQQRALGFDRQSFEIRAEWLQEPTLRGFNLQEAERTLREVLAYRVWFDQRRGWRYTNPNLEELKLLRVEYLGLEELAGDDELFRNALPLLREASTETRVRVYTALLDHLRKGMAIRSHVLEATVAEQLLSRSHSRLRPPWGFGIDEKPRRARWLFAAAPPRRANTVRDEDVIVRGGVRSTLGRALKRPKLWNDARARDLKTADYDALLSSLLRAAAIHGLVSEEPTPFGEVVGWKLNDACVRFHRATVPAAALSRENAFFRALYANLAAMLQQPVHPLFEFEAREHTAQVDSEKRRIREKRFRYGLHERDDLAQERGHLLESASRPSSTVAS